MSLQVEKKRQRQRDRRGKYRIRVRYKYHHYRTIDTDDYGSFKQMYEKYKGQYTFWCGDQPPEKEYIEGTYNGYRLDSDMNPEHVAGTLKRYGKNKCWIDPTYKVDGKPVCLVYNAAYRTNRKNGGIFRTTTLGDVVELPNNELNEFLGRHIYSYRDVPIGEFARLYKMYPDFQSQIREKYRSLESGRLGRSMDAFHSFFWNLDRDEMELFKSRNPNIVAMMNEWAVVEDLAEFE